MPTRHRLTGVAASALVFWACKADHPTAPPAPPVPFVMTVAFNSSVYPLCHFTGQLEDAHGQLLFQSSGKVATLDLYVPLGQAATDTLWLSGAAPEPVVWIYNAYIGSISGWFWNTGAIISVTGPYAGTFFC